ncbi:MAG: porin [Proteobacteria bacterium]|nr:porin [Pseudomonadota bacterium]
MKKIFALAVVAAAAAPAFAQSSVTIYGRLNVTAESVKIGSAKEDNMLNNNASRIGFKGVEDLGGGLKAGFQLEHGLDPTDGQASGGSRFWNRHSELWLGGNWGTVRMGYWFPETYMATADYISMHNHDTGRSADQFYVGTFATNRVGYRTPKFGAFQAEVDVAEGKVYNLSGTASFGRYEFGAGYSQADGADKQFALRGNATFGAFTVGAYYQRAQDWTLLGDRDSYRLAGMYTMGAFEFHANVGFAGEWSNVTDSDATQYTLGVNYNLSKRTKVYGYYSEVNNKAAAAYLSGIAGADSKSFAVGVRHNF